MPSFSSAITSKLPAVGTTIFTVMSKLAQEHNAINLSQGFPDFDCAPRLLELVAKYFNAGLNQYPPMAGVMALRERVVEKAAALYGATYDPEHEATIVPGATYGIFTAITAFVRPGDEVVLFEPTYDSYAPAVEVNGGRPVYVRLQYPDYSIDWNAVQQAITPKTRMIVINTPNNPTTSVFSAEDMRAFENILRNTNIIVVADEVYEHLIYDGHQHQSVARFPGLAERSFVVSSFGKTYHATGWKIGYCIAPAALTSEFRKVHQFVQFSVATPLQAAIADFLVECPQHHLELPAFYQQKRDYFLDILAQTRLAARPAAGTYFQLADYSAISDRPDVEFVESLTVETGVAAIPVSAFCTGAAASERLIRFCFAKDTATLDAAGERLRKI